MMSVDYSKVGLALLTQPDLDGYYCDRCDEGLGSGDVEVDNNDITILCDNCRWPHRLVLRLDITPVYPWEGT